MKINRHEDLNGYIRGAHQDGEDICPQFLFHMPGSSSTPERAVWGWNDIAAFDCDRCKRPATEHIVIKAPAPYDPGKNLETKIKGISGKTGEAITLDGGGPTIRSPTDMLPDTEERKKREAEAAAFINAGYSPDGMLDESNDPLAVNARPKPKKSQPPPQQPAPSLQPAPRPAAQPAPAAPMPTAPADLAEGVQDPALQELLARDAAANDAFKREVERMVREANREQELKARAGAAGSATATAGGAAGSGGGGGGGGGGIVENKDLSGCTVPIGTFADASALLSSVSLADKYLTVFEEEAMDPDTLIEVLQQQGRSALEDALKELGIKSMGHRLKIINALIIQ